MTDLRVLLAEAAPAPAAPPDFVALVRAGRRRNIARRIKLGFAAVALVAGVGGAGANVFAPAAPPQQLSADRNTSAVDSDVSVESPVSDVAERGGTRASATPGDADAKSAETTLPAGPPPVNDFGPATTVVQEKGDEGCELTGRTEGGVTAGPLYGNASGWPTCTYRATEAGGYSNQGTWRIEIRRGGEQITFTSGRDPQCAGVGVVQPGDEVTVMLANDGSDPDDRFVRIGPDHHC